MNETHRPAVQEVDIKPDEEGQRLDNFLFARLKGVPKSRIYRLLRKGEVRINRGRAKPEYRLKAGDRVRIPPVRTAERPSATPSDRVLTLIEQGIIYEDSQLLVLNKPSGVAVHGGSGVSYGVIEALRALRPRASFLELVHRLDRDTSGCLIIAKKRSTLRALHEVLRDKGADKRYLALVRGQWRDGDRRVEAPLVKNVLRSGERIVQAGAQGKSALSLFHPISIYDVASLVEVRILTGRTHQVRVHAAHIGHPIAGDEKYGDPLFNRLLAEMGLHRLFLHASAISLPLPGGNLLSVSAPMDSELARVIDKLEAMNGTRAESAGI